MSLVHHFSFLDLFAGTVCEWTGRHVSLTHSSVQLVIDGEDIIMEISYIKNSQEKKKLILVIIEYYNEYNLYIHICMYLLL